MFDIELTDQTLIVRMRGRRYQFLALHREVEVALAHVREVTVGISPELRQLPFRATRKRGSRMVLATMRLFIGKFGTLRGGDYFYAIRTGERAITITLEHERFRGLVLEVEDPEGMASTISAAAERARAAKGAAR
jgi:hypothetical protein